MEFLKFLASPRGRLLRIVVGLVLVWLGAYVFTQPWSTVVWIIAAVPLISAALNVCLLGPIMGSGLWGSELKSR